MCFYNDGYDWTAEVVSEKEGAASKDAKCQECRRVIPAGHRLWTVFQQECEECKTCDEGDCECPKDKRGDCMECKCEKPNFGEEFDYHSCLDCKRFLDAVSVAEVESGCSVYESRPAYMEMIESVSSAGVDESDKYFAKADEMFPDLRQSGYLDWLKAKMFPKE
jgi:hypothetical protein